MLKFALAAIMVLGLVLPGNFIAYAQDDGGGDGGGDIGGDVGGDVGGDIGDDAGSFDAGSPDTAEYSEDSYEESGMTDTGDTYLATTSETVTTGAVRTSVGTTTFGVVPTVSDAVIVGSAAGAVAGAVVGAENAPRYKTVVIEKKTPADKSLPKKITVDTTKAGPAATDVKNPANDTAQKNEPGKTAMPVENKAK